MIGPVGDLALKAALDEAKAISAIGADLILACVDTPHALAAALRQVSDRLA